MNDIFEDWLVENWTWNPNAEIWVHKTKRLAYHTENLYGLWEKKSGRLVHHKRGTLMVIKKDTLDFDWEEVSFDEYPDYKIYDTGYSKLIRKL